MKGTKLLLIGIFISNGSCATTQSSTAIGAATGAAVGVGIGALADPGAKGRGRIKNFVVGGLAGGAFGAMAGYRAPQPPGGNEPDAALLASSGGSAQGALGVDPSGGKDPVLAPAKVEVQFIDDQVRGNTFVPAHFEYRIVEPARWSK